MEKCSQCEARAVWICECSQILLCSSHRKEHLDIDIEHNIKKVKVYLSPEQSQELASVLTSRIKLLESCSQKILETTTVLIKKIKNCCAESLSQLIAQKNYYANLFPLIKNNVTDKDLLEIEKITKSVLWFSGSLQVPDCPKIIEFYSQSFFELRSDVLEVTSLNQDNFDAVLRQGLVLGDDIFSVSAIRVASDKKTIVFACSDSNIYIWDLNKKTQQGFFKGHGLGVLSIAITQDKSFFVSGGFEKTMRIWSCLEMKLTGTLVGHESYVYRIEVTKDDFRVISCSDDKTLRIWNLKEKTQESVILAGETCIYKIAVADNSEFVLFEIGKNIGVWEFEGKVQSVLEGHRLCIYKIAVSSDSLYCFSAGYDRTVRVWDISKKSEIAVFTSHKAALEWINQYKELDEFFL